MGKFAVSFTYECRDWLITVTWLSAPNDNIERSDAQNQNIAERKKIVVWVVSNLQRRKDESPSFFFVHHNVNFFFVEVMASRTLDDVENDWTFVDKDGKVDMEVSYVFNFFLVSNGNVLVFERFLQNKARDILWEMFFSRSW